MNKTEQRQRFNTVIAAIDEQQEKFNWLRPHACIGCVCKLIANDQRIDSLGSIRSYYEGPGIEDSGYTYIKRYLGVDSNTAIMVYTAAHSNLQKEYGLEYEYSDNLYGPASDAITMLKALRDKICPLKPTEELSDDLEAFVSQVEKMVLP